MIYLFILWDINLYILKKKRKEIEQAFAILDAVMCIFLLLFV
jgi:hypothetical protein